MKKAIIFDMDGVLVDNTKYHVEAFIIFCKKYGYDMPKDALMPFFGMGNDEIMPGIFGREFTPEEISKMGEEKELIYRDIFEKNIAPQKGLVDLLKDLKSRGVKIAVGSSAMRKNVDFVLESCSIAEYFDVITCGDDVKKAKPNPQVFELSAQRLGVKPEDCVVFEDAFVGVEASRKANMKVVVLTTTYPRNLHKDYDLLIDDFTQVTAEKVLNL